MHTQLHQAPPIANDPSSDIPQTSEGVKDDGLTQTPKGGGDPSVTTPLGSAGVVGCRIIPSAVLLESCRNRLKDQTTEVWGQNLRAATVTLLVGETSVGKTVFLHRLAYHLAKGEEFLGQGPPRPMRVLYVDFESNHEVLAEHMTEIGVAEGWDFYDLEDESLELGKPLISALKMEVQEGKYDVVIIDPLMEAYPVSDENDNVLANDQMLACRHLARSTQAAVVVIHNSGKRSGKKNEKHLGRGATAREDRADIAINLTVGKNQVRHLKIVKARSGNIGEEMRFRFSEGLDYELLSLPPPGQTLVAKLETQVMEHMMALASQGISKVERKTLIEYLSITTEAGKQAFDRARRQCSLKGKLVKVKKGVYALPEEGKVS